jgi:hypothetical protein
VWKGGLEKVLGDLDRVMASILAGLVKLGLVVSPLGARRVFGPLGKHTSPSLIPFVSPSTNSSFIPKGLLSTVLTQL